MNKVPSNLFTLNVRTVIRRLNIYIVFTLFHVTPAADGKTEEQQELLPGLHEGQGWLLHFQ